MHAGLHACKWNFYKNAGADHKNCDFDHQKGGLLFDDVPGAQLWPKNLRRQNFQTSKDYGKFQTVWCQDMTIVANHHCES